MSRDTHILLRFLFLQSDPSGMTDSDKGLDDLLEDDAYALPSSQPANATDLVTLNVGGSIFCTSKSTLFKYPGSYCK